jgi:hypothetical protein
VQARGPGAKRNFPTEAISEPPATKGESGVGRKRKGSSSLYIGVSWKTAGSSWHVKLTDPQTKFEQHIGYYASEEDAARAYDCAVVQARGPGSKRNFPTEAISEPPATKGKSGVGRKRKGSSSLYIGVSWKTAGSSWHVKLTDPQTKCEQHIGYYASEEDAARAYDCAAVQMRGPGAKRNFPDEAISDPPVSKREERKQRSSSRYIGVSWNKAMSSSREGACR